jgi:hypothetical protein
MEPKRKFQKEEVKDENPEIDKWVQTICTKTNKIEVKYDAMF